MNRKFQGRLFTTDRDYFTLSGGAAAFGKVEMRRSKSDRRHTLYYPEGPILIDATSGSASIGRETRLERGLFEVRLTGRGDVHTRVKKVG